MRKRQEEENIRRLRRATESAKLMRRRGLMLIFLVQILFFFAMSFLLGSYLSIYFSSFYIFGTLALNIILVLYILTSSRNPAYKLAWTIFVTLFAPISTLFYIFFCVIFRPRRIMKKINKAAKSIKDFFRSDIKTGDPRTDADITFFKNTSGFVPYDKTSVKYYDFIDKLHKDMLIELEKAKDYIFMEFFIFHDGFMLSDILKILYKKVKEGVDVRVIYDGMGSYGTLSRKTLKEMKAAGIKTCVFNKMRIAFNIFQNYRDHRKIVVVDGKCAFTGGFNIGDEYINKQKKFGVWKDSGVMVKGAGVYSFTIMFLRMWQLIENKLLDYSPYSRTEAVETDGIVLPYGDSPANSHNPGQGTYLNIINGAEKYVWIQTPYLIIDNELLTALINRALAGIDIRIVTPGIPDKKSAFMVTRSYYKALIGAGVKIYEYSPGFIHSKVCLSDDICAVVGSINFDFRSLYQQFESAVYMTGSSAIKDIRADFDGLFSGVCKQISLSDCNPNIFVRLLTSFLILFAPLM